MISPNSSHFNVIDCRTMTLIVCSSDIKLPVDLLKLTKRTDIDIPVEVNVGSPPYNVRDPYSRCYLKLCLTVAGSRVCPGDAEC